MVTDCDRGMPLVMSHPSSEAAKAFQGIASRVRTYTGLKNTEIKSEQEQILNQLRTQEVKG